MAQWQRTRLDSRRVRPPYRVLAAAAATLAPEGDVGIESEPTDGGRLFTIRFADRMREIAFELADEEVRALQRTCGL